MLTTYIRYVLGWAASEEFLSMVARVNAYEVAKRSPQEVRDKWRALKEAALNYPDQLDKHILETTTSEIHVAILV